MDEIKFKGMTIPETERVHSKNFGEKAGTFEIKIPLPFEKVQIYNATSRAIGGADLASIRPEDYEYARMLVSLNFVVSESPKWWNGADNCVDDDFLLELWKFYLECEKKFQSWLKKNT